jgi:hypothetical protein
MQSGDLAAPGKVLGVKTPRLVTPPLVELTPETSYGYEVISFAKHIVELPLDPWQEEAVIRAGELLPDGMPRFRVVVILVARQAGKTTLIKVLTLYWLFKAKVGTVLSMANKRSTAKEIWEHVCNLAQNNDVLRMQMPDKAVFTGMGSEKLITNGGGQYVFSAANSNAGRGLTINRLIIDELRQHRDRTAWNAAKFATNAVVDAQIVCISNQGDDTGILLDELRKSALDFIETGEGDPRLGLIEWSAPDGADPTDIEALAMANPTLGGRMPVDAIMGDAIRARAAGGQEMADFRTEVMCMRVRLMDPAIDPDAWKRCGADEPVDLAEHRKRVVACLDIAMDGSHASLVAACTIDGTTHVEVLGAWSGWGCTQLVRKELPELVAKVRPRQIGWFPNGPGAALTADLTASRTRGWPPRGTELVEIRGEVTAVAMGLCDAVATNIVSHPRDPLLDAHVGAAQKLYRGDAFAFRRVGADPIDGAYALAGAVHLARLLPPPRPPVTVL